MLKEGHILYRLERERYIFEKKTRPSYVDTYYTGIRGIGISIGKLDLYVAAAGINPQRVLPIMIDIGTNNQALLKDPLYLGLQHRLDGEEYIAVIDEFMEAVFTRWPHVIVQW
ncbi:unnamed protein product [Lactuca virosa]|uniref:Malic enzyme N-terminal domain-containing protein n=1 Tax=Lactuca virosa TaxID=75947 RepID=A0AAU9MTL0_9ASTR|nr:unnamed protein product [Lactuca virosa]